MPFQRARAAESRVRNKSLNGPLRVQSKHRSRNDVSILQREGHTSVARDIAEMPYPKAHSQAVNQGGTADQRIRP